MTQRALKIMLGLREIQDTMPKFWSDKSYPDNFNYLPLPHRHYNHALTHAMKALGGLAALSDALDHQRMMERNNSDPEYDSLRDNAGKWLADLVICAARMAEQLQIDLDEETQVRVATLTARYGDKP